jgi:hypothetical protein
VRFQNPLYLLTQKWSRFSALCWQYRNPHFLQKFAAHGGVRVPLNIV